MTSRTQRTARRLLGLAALALLSLAAATALAGGTKSLRYTSYREFDDAETKGVLISSNGELLTGHATRKVEIKVPFVRASVTAPDGTVFLGTGDGGELYAFERGAVRKVAKIDTPVLSTLCLGPGGAVLAGTVADGRVLSVDPRTGSWKELAQIDKKGETHIWALVYDAKRSVVYAATGPKGHLYAIEGGKTRLVWDSGEKQILSLQLANDGSGALYAGTGERAILYRVEPTGRARVLHSFAADELHAIVERAGSLFIAVNDFGGSMGGMGGGTGGTRIAFGSTPALPAKAALPRMGARSGKGAIYRWDPDGRIEQLFALADSYFAAVHVDGSGDVFAAAGGQGRVYQIKPDRTSYTAYEFPERQVLVMEMKGPRLFGTGDPGVLYVSEPGAPKGAQFTSKVFDAGFLARYGQLRWSGHGKVQFETRSGNTAKPDKTWSGWSKVEGAAAVGEVGHGRIKSAESRYLQFRVLLGENVLLRSLTLYYLPQNQRPKLTEVTVGEPRGSAPGGFGGFGGMGGTPARVHSTMVKIRWKVENPDNDELTYRLFIREESESVWRPLGGTDPLTKTEFDWQTEAIPDGHYLARVIVTDEKSNPKDRALMHELVSAQAYLVDNRKPEVLGLEVRYPFLSGRARDSYSVLSELAYSIDGGEWVPFYPSDGIFDDTVKTFTVRLPDALPAGQHTVAVRTADEADNVGSAQVTFRVTK